jgi:Sec-independent protein translocase protein TatA
MDTTGKILELFQDGGAVKSTSIFKMKLNESHDDGDKDEDADEDKDKPNDDDASEQRSQKSQKSKNSHRSHGSHHSHHDNVGMEGEMDDGVPDVRVDEAGDSQ